MATRTLRKVTITYDPAGEAQLVRADGVLLETIGTKERDFHFQYERKRTQLTTGQQEYLDQIATFLNSYLNTDEPLT